jgi:hypothetical protein
VALNQQVTICLHDANGSATQHIYLVSKHTVELLGPGIGVSLGLFLHQSTPTLKELQYIYV